MAISLWIQIAAELSRFFRAVLLAFFWTLCFAGVIMALFFNLGKLFHEGMVMQYPITYMVACYYIAAGLVFGIPLWIMSRREREPDAPRFRGKSLDEMLQNRGITRDEEAEGQ